RLTVAVGADDRQEFLRPAVPLRLGLVGFADPRHEPFPAAAADDLRVVPAAVPRHAPQAGRGTAVGADHAFAGEGGEALVQGHDEIGPSVFAHFACSAASSSAVVVSACVVLSRYACTAGGGGRLERPTAGAAASPGVVG